MQNPNQKGKTDRFDYRKFYCHTKDIKKKVEDKQKLHTTCRQQRISSPNI